MLTLALQNETSGADSRKSCRSLCIKNRPGDYLWAVFSYTNPLPNYPDRCSDSDSCDRPWRNPWAVFSCAKYNCDKVMLCRYFLSKESEYKRRFGWRSKCTDAVAPKGPIPPHGFYSRQRAGSRSSQDPYVLVHYAMLMNACINVPQ